MDGWYQSSRPRYSPTVRGIRKPNMSSSGKIISIPVHFVGSETAAALKIQKVVRGFLVRKSIKRILAIKGEVKEIEGRLSKKETMELIRKDVKKERLRINETLMALLFKLDSIRGVYPGIRDCRKDVIRKAVALQEKVDCIVSASDDQTLHSADGVDNSDLVAESVDQSLEMKSEDGVVESDCVSAEAPVAVDLKYEDPQPESANESNLDLVDVIPTTEVQTENCEKMDYEVVISDDEEAVVKEITEDCSAIPRAYANDERKRNDEILERMMEENEKMMKMVRQLCESNEMHTHMLTSLMHRVECLEKAFVSNNKLRKKKKPNHSA